MLLPPKQHLPSESSTDVDAPNGHITLDAILQQLAASQGCSKAVALLARQALDLGSKQVRTCLHVTSLAASAARELRVILAITGRSFSLGYLGGDQ